MLFDWKQSNHRQDRIIRQFERLSLHVPPIRIGSLEPAISNFFHGSGYVPRLFEELAVAHGDGRYVKLITQLAKVDVLLLDDWGVAMLTDSARRDLLEILDDRYGQRSTIITSQLKVDDWHESIGDPILADAILDRLVHNAHKLDLSGESMRKSKRGLTKPANQE